MEAQLKVGPFNLVVRNQDYTIGREDFKGEVTLLASQTDEAIQAVINALSVEDFKVLPPVLKNQPFQVDFTKERVLYLKFQEVHGSGVPFRFEDGEELISALKLGRAKLVDMNTIEAGQKRGFALGSVPDPIVSGR